MEVDKGLVEQDGSPERLVEKVRGKGSGIRRKLITGARFILIAIAGGALRSSPLVQE